MPEKRAWLALALLCALLLSGCNLPTLTPAATRTAAVPLSPTGTGKAAPTLPPDVPVTPIPLTGPLAKSSAEISGLAWYQDYLILLPQYPKHVSQAPGGALYALKKADILAYLDSSRQDPLVPQEIPLVPQGENQVAGYEGFEAIGFAGQQVYLTIEASPLGRMKSYLLEGEMAPDLSQITLQPERRVEAPLDVQISNLSNEALIVTGQQVILFYEANGAKVYPQPRAQAYTLDLQPDGSLDLPHLEYRLTDATQPDSQGRFWVINYAYPGDLKLLTNHDPLAEQFGQSPSQENSSVVERLVQMQVQDGSIQLTGRPPVQLKLLEGQVPRNWEGIVRLDERGFLLATDEFPETIFAFVPASP